MVVRAEVWDCRTHFILANPRCAVGFERKPGRRPGHDTVGTDIDRVRSLIASASFHADQRTRLSVAPPRRVSTDRTAPYQRTCFPLEILIFSRPRGILGECWTSPRFRLPNPPRLRND